MGIKNYTSNVDASVSLGEIQAALARAGALQIMVDYDNGEPQAVSFGMMGPCGKIGFKLPAPVEGTMQAFTRQKIKADKEQATRTAWRNVRDWVLAQVALMESCTIDAAQCFLPYMVDRSGTTLYEAYSSGRLMLGNGEET